MNISVKFPAGMSDRDKQIIFSLLEQNIKANEGETEEQILRKCQAFIEEHLLLSVRQI
jgi:hypothetical protein